MSLDTRGIDPRRPDVPRLLPQSMEDRLLRLLARAAGAIMLASVGLAWLSLVSWSVNDPSLTHATTAEPQNWLGPFGAILSDLKLQTLGFGCVIALVAPLVWSLDLMRHARLHGGRLKFTIYPLSILAMGGALSALPAPDAWPLHHGLGGALGDGLFKAVEGIFALINSDRAGLAAAIVLIAAATSMAARSIGLRLDHAVAQSMALARRLSAEFWQRRKWSAPTSHAPSDVDTPREWPTFSAPVKFTAITEALRGATVRRGDVEQSAATSSPGDAIIAPPAWQDEEASPEFAEFLRSRGAPFGPSGYAAAPVAQAGGSQPPDRRHDTMFSASDLPPVGAAGDDVSREPEFDAFTDAASRAIAARFAPASRDAPRGPEPMAAAPKTESPEVADTAPASRTTAQARNQGWSRPPLNLLTRGVTSKPGPEISQTAMRGAARLIEDALADFGVKGEIKSISPGPVVTLYDFEPARGVKSSRVIGLADDIARSMSVASVRAAVAPGRNAIGLELPNVRREAVMLRDILDSDAFRNSDAALPLALGKSIAGAPVVVDLARMPHLLVAGTTGSGKSVGVNAMILSLLYRAAPDDCRLLMIDPKMLELSVYNDIPHLLTPVVTDPVKAVSALNWAVGEMEERYKRMAALSVRNIDVFNNRVRNAKKRGEVLARSVQTGFDARGQAIIENQRIAYETMPHIVIVVDEFADLMMVAGKDVEAAVQRLAQMARAAGIHLIMATQRPSVDVLTGTIKANFPTRLSFKVASKIDSRTILNEQGAEQLLGQGDMLFSSGAGQLTRVHGAFVSDDEVVAVADALRRERAPDYAPGLLEPRGEAEAAVAIGSGGDGDLFDRAVAVVMRDRKASTSYLQRRLSIGYNRAADLIERMEADGLITPANAVGRRDILMTGSGD